MKKRFDVHNVHITTLARQSSKFAENKRRRNFFALVLVLISAGSWTYAISSFTYLDRVNIGHVSISGADPDILPALEAAALRALEGDYLGLFSKSNFLLISKADISEAIKETSPRIESLSIRRSGLGSLDIQVHEKSPAALVCAGLPNFSIAENAETGGQSENCFFTDASGVIYMKAGVFPVNMYNSYYLLDIENDAPQNDAIGREAFASSTFRALQGFYESMRLSRVNPLGILVKGGGEYELFIENPGKDKSVVGTSTPVETIVVYFNEVNGFENQISNFVSFWSHMLTDARTKNEYLNFETIDLRFGSNVFYRLVK
ncbi:MAG: hypothetical protein WCV79_01145 [Candidatus Paceibacterota bacterium]|jgi:hypothetical protein